MSYRPAFQVAVRQQASDSAGHLLRVQLVLQHLERVALRLWIKEQHGHELYRDHDCEKREGQHLRSACNYRKRERDDAVHDPVRRRAQGLALGTNIGGEYLAQVHPNDCPLRNSEETDEAYQQRKQQPLVSSLVKSRTRQSHSRGRVEGWGGVPE